MMKNLIILFLLVTACSFGQTTTKTQYDAFKKELETYLVNSEGIKPAACGDYVLKFIVKNDNKKETVFPMNTKSLCEDLSKFDSSKLENLNPEWSYDIKAVGDKYYIIRGDKATGSVTQFFYYYQRK